MKRQHVVLLVCLATACFAQQLPRGLGPVEYYRTPQIGVMAGFIKDPEHQGYTIEEWRKDLGRNFDARALVTRVKQAGAAHLIFYDKWIDGLVFHQTRTTSYRTERDFLALVAPECHRQNLKLIVYFNTFMDGNPEFAPWTSVDRRGAAIRYMHPWPANAMSIHSPYREKALEQIRELIQNYDVDGFWLDVPEYPAFTFDKWSGEAFHKQYGKSLDEATALEHMRFATDSITAWLKTTSDYIHKLKPSAVVGSNRIVDPLHMGPRRALGMAPSLDYFTAELWPIETQWKHAEYLGWFTKPSESLTMLSDTWFTPLTGGPPPTTKKAAQLTLELANTLSAGVNPYGSLALAHDGSLDEPTLQLLDASGRWLRKMRPYLEGATTMHDVGIVLGTAQAADLDWPGGLEDYSEVIDKLEGHLRHHGYLPRRLLTCAGAQKWDHIPDGMRLLVIPDRVSLSPQDAQLVREFARRGGAVLALGRGAGLGHSGRFVDADPLFGTHADGPVTLPSARIAWEGKRYNVKAPFWHLRPEAAEVVRWIASPLRGEVPALVRKQTAYASALTESALLETPELFDAILTSVLAETTYSFSDKSGRYRFRLRRQNGQYLIHVLDDINAPTARGYVDRYVPRYVKVSVNTALVPFGKATVVPDRRELTLTRDGNWSTFEIFPSPEVTIRLE
jgi:alpha-L-fucosidase